MNKSVNNPTGILVSPVEYEQMAPAEKTSYTKEKFRFCCMIAEAVALLFAILATALAAGAQTNTNTLPPLTIQQLFGTNSTGVGTSTFGQLGGAVLSFLSDATPFYGTSNGVVYDDVILYNSKHIGDLFAVHVPITALSTNGQIAAGAAIAWFRNDWYSLTINAEAGATWNVPVIGAVYTSIGSGPDWNFHTQQPGAFSYTRLERNWDIWSGHKLGLTGGIANETSVAGIIYFGGLTLAW